MVKPPLEQTQILPPSAHERTQRIDPPPGAQVMADDDIGMIGIGQTVSGRFRIEREIGVGGMGRVFEAEDLQLKRAVAIKAVHTHLVQDREWLENLRFEARVIARMRHPGIVQVYEIIEAAGGPLMVMEYVEGQTLSDAIAAGGLSRAQFLALMEQVCAAVGHAHAHGIVHHDLKAGNVMLTADGHCKIMDFGIASGGSGEGFDHLAGGVTGSPAYMSPEMFQGRGRGETRSDVYGLGVMLYHGLSGSLPFRAETLEQLTAQVVSSRPEPLALRVPGIAADLAAICMCAMARDPDARYVDARAVAEELRRQREGLPVAAREYPLATRIGRAVSYHWRSFIAALLASVLLFIGVNLTADHLHVLAEEALLVELEGKLAGLAATSALAVEPGADQAAIEQQFAPLRPLIPGIEHIRLETNDGSPEYQRAQAGEVVIQREGTRPGDPEATERLAAYAPIHDRDGRVTGVLTMAMTNASLLGHFADLEVGYRQSEWMASVVALLVLVLSVASMVVQWQSRRA